MRSARKAKIRSASSEVSFRPSSSRQVGIPSARSTRFSGEIGFYPEEYLEIIRLYLGP